MRKRLGPVRVRRSKLHLFFLLLLLLPSRGVLCTPYNHAPCHFMQSHIRNVHACLAVTCHLHIWQNDRDLLRVTAVTRGWNGYRNKSQHRKSTLEHSLIVQELCESRGGRPGLSVLTTLLVSMDVKLYRTMLRHWSQLDPNMSTDIRGH